MKKSLKVAICMILTIAMMLVSFACSSLTEPDDGKLTITATAGEGGEVTGGGDYDENTMATVVATASAGYTFTNWTVDDVEVSTDATYQFTVIAEITLVANFAEIPPTPKYTITVVGGSGSGEYEEGTEVTIVAEDVEGEIFAKWINADDETVSTDATYTFEAEEDITLTAVTQVSGGLFVFEAEDADLSGVNLPTAFATFTQNNCGGASSPLFANNWPGYDFTALVDDGAEMSGGMCVEYLEINPPTGIVWKINSSKAATATLTFRLAANLWGGSDWTTQASVISAGGSGVAFKLNDTDLILEETVTLSPKLVEGTQDDSNKYLSGHNFSDAISFTVDLVEGENTISLMVLNANERPSVDCIKISNTDAVLTWTPTDNFAFFGIDASYDPRA